MSYRTSLALLSALALAFSAAASAAEPTELSGDRVYLECTGDIFGNGVESVQVAFSMKDQRMFWSSQYKEMYERVQITAEEILFNRNENGAWTMRIDRRTGAYEVLGLKYAQCRRIESWTRF